MKLEAARPNEVRELIELNGAELDAVTGGVSSLLTTWKCVHTCDKTARHRQREAIIET